MPDHTLFPFIDTAMRFITVLALCFVPLLIPISSLRRVLRATRERLRSRTRALADVRER